MIEERVYTTVDPERLRTEPIRIWRFDEAPIELQAYSNNGGDEDWLAFVPREYTSEDLPLPVGVHSVAAYTTEHGDRVFIGCHA